MTRAALTKLLILVILAFIICLPEFFSSNKVSKVQFLCQSYQPCERGRQVKKGENGKIRDAEVEKQDMCDFSQTAELEKWEEACVQGNQSNMTDPASDSRRGSNDSEKRRFICQTDTNMLELHSKVSSSATVRKAHLEVSVELHLSDTQMLNLTLFGHSNYSPLALRPPEEQEEEEDKRKDDEGQRAFYCCLPAPPTSGSASQSRCLLWLTNQTVSTATANEKLPWKQTKKDEWWCIAKVLWLALLCVVLLTVITTVLGQIYLGKYSYKTPTVSSMYVSSQQLNDGGKDTEIITCRELSCIEEAASEEEIETLLDGHDNHCYTANLHHRGHPFTSSLTEEQQEDKSTEMDLK